jgi:hypothetical protein
LVSLYSILSTKYGSSDGHNIAKSRRTLITLSKAGDGRYKKATKHRAR